MNQRSSMGGMAPSPKQMEAILEARRAAGHDIDAESPQGSIRNEDFPEGIREGTPLGFVYEVKNIIYGLHWQYQKQVLDIVQAALGHHEKQWVAVRKLIMDVSTAQIRTQLKIVTQRLRQEMEDEPGVGIRFERRTVGDAASDASAEAVGPPAEITDDDGN